MSGKDPVPKPKVLKGLAQDFGVAPETILEYKQYLAVEKIKKNPELLEPVLSGEITKGEGVGKIIKLSGPKTVIPIVGYAPASSLKEAFETHLGDVPQIEGADFAIQVSGDCLIEAGILDKDIVYIKKQPFANKGDLTLVRIDGEITLKFFYKEKAAVRLEPANKDCEPIISKEVEVIGVKVAILRR